MLQTSTISRRGKGSKASQERSRVAPSSTSERVQQSTAKRQVRATLTVSEVISDRPVNASMLATISACDQRT